MSNYLCCYPKCEADVSLRVDEPLCERHLLSVFRSVFALNDKNLIPVIEGLPRPTWHKYSTVGVVYFIRFGDRIKIGFTTDLSKRLKAVPNDELLLTLPGTRFDEARFHRKFAHLRVVGEWFTSGTDLLDFINSTKLETRHAETQ